MEVNMSSPVPEISKMENDGGHVGAVKLTKSQIKNRKRALRKKKKKNLDLLDKREDTENAKSSVTALSSHFSNKLEVHFSNISVSSLSDKSDSGLGTTATVDQKMTVSIVAATGDGKSSNSGTENDKGNGAATLTKTQRKKMRKLAKKKLNAIAGGQTKNKIVNRRPTIGEILDPLYLQKLEAANGEGSGTTATDNPASKQSETQKNVNKNPALDCGGTHDKVIAEKGSGVGKVFEATNGELVATKSAVPDVMIVPKGEQHTEVHFSNISVSSLPDKSNSGHVTTAIVDQKATVSTVAATGDGKSSNTGTENDKGNGAAKITKSQRRKMRKLAKKESNAMTGGQTENTKVNMKPTMGEILDPLYLQKLEAANGEGTTATDKPASKKRKAQKNVNKNPALGCVETHDKVIAEKGLGAGKVFEATGDEMVPPGVTMVPKGELHTEVSNGNTATDNSASKRKKRQKSENTNSASGDIMKTCEKVIEEKGLGTTKSIEAISSEMVTGRNTIPDALMVSKVEEHAEVANGKSATDNSASKKKRKRGNKNKNPALGEIAIICDNMQEKVIAENGLGMTKSIEPISSEMVTGKNAIPDSSMVSKVEEPTEVANGKTATDNPASKKKSENKNQPLVDIMISCDNTQEKIIAENGPDITKSVEAISSEMVTGKNAIPDASMVSKVEEHTEVASGKTGPGTAATVTTASKKRKRRKLKKKGLTSDGILSIGESAQDTVIVNKVSGTNKPLEALSTESKREEFPELLGDEKGPKTITGDAESTMLKTIGCTKVSNSEIGSTGTTTTSQNSPLPKKTSRQRKKRKSVALNTINNTEVEQITQVATLGKKLVIFDVNGLLADVVFSGPKDVKADKVIRRRAIFKRPFLDDFLRFCFERFNVGIWSSRTKPVLDPVVDFLLGDLKNKLLFLWDASKCTNSGLRTLEDRHKPVVFKDLRKIWEKKDPENRWVKGTFNESNTLLLDDSPYKALLNPKHSGIFPASYTYKNLDDDFLGPKGELQTYLEGVAAADNVKSYVEQHPFGQGAIDEKNPQWSYYSRALKGQNR